MVIRNLWPEEILPVWSFNGLSSLKELIFLDAQVAVGRWITINISFNLLGFASNTLNSLTLTERVRNDEYRKHFSIERMLGRNAVTLTNLEYVNVKYNLTAINSFSFLAIPYIRVLNLSDCHISTIAADTFDVLNRTLLILNLERNELVTLADGTFMNLNLSPTASAVLSIHLDENPWHCGCKLVFAQGLLNNYTNFHGNFLCKTPPEIENYPIRESTFCPYPEITSSTTQIPSTETTATTDWHNDFRELQCTSVNETIAESVYVVHIQAPMVQMKVEMVSDVDLIVSVERDDLGLIWFGSVQVSGVVGKSMEFQRSERIDCVSRIHSGQITVRPTEKLNTFCLIKLPHTTVSPLDCMSYYHHGHDSIQFGKVWLAESSRMVAIGVICAALVSNVVVGIIAAVIFSKVTIYGNLW